MYCNLRNDLVQETVWVTPEGSSRPNCTFMRACGTVKFLLRRTQGHGSSPSAGQCPVSGLTPSRYSRPSHMYAFFHNPPLVTLLTAWILTFSGASLAADTPEPPVVKRSMPQAVQKERITLAREAIQAQDWKGAIAVLTEAVQVHPGNPELHNLLGYTYRKQATPDLPRAFENYRLALRFDPEHRGANEYIGEAYLMDKNPAKAEEHLAQLQRICGNTSCEEYQDLSQAIARYRARNK